MSNAAIYWNPEAYDTTGKALMGRHSAGEGFMRGFIRYGADNELLLWNVVNRKTEDLEALLKRLEPTSKKTTWIAQGDHTGLSNAGVVNLPVPGLARYAWGRNLRSKRAYSLCGVTHTTRATMRVLEP